MDAQRIPVGFIKRAHGVRGDLLVVPLTDHDERFVSGSTFAVGNDDDRMVTVRTVRTHNEGLILTLSEVADRTAAELLVKQVLTIDPAERRALDADEYWPDDLVGLVAVTVEGATLGSVTDVVLGAAQDRLVVTTEAGQQVEVPFVSAIVDPPSGNEVVLRPPEGLFSAE